MSREIKFRAWDKGKKCFIDVYNIIWDWENTIYTSSWSIITSNRFSWTTLSLKDTEELVWVQYTWLKDKNWKEIYVWDVVEDMWVIQRWPDILFEFYTTNWETSTYPYFNFEMLEWEYQFKDLEIKWNIYENKKPNIFTK